MDKELLSLCDGVEFLLREEFFKELLKFYKDLSDGKYGEFMGGDCCPGRKKVMERLRKQVWKSEIKERIEVLYHLMEK